MRSDASGGHGSPASPHGAKSKRMSRPPQRCDDAKDACGTSERDEPASSNEPQGRLSFNVPF